MSRTVYIHVGAPKTGTTYIQDRLALNRALLARHDVHYPLGLLSSHFRPALDLLGLSWGGLGAEAAGQWDALAGRVRRSEGAVIVSHEILAGATPAQVDRALTSFGDSEIHVVYSARDIARQVPAEWQESIKHRRRRTFGRFTRLVVGSPRTDSNLWFWKVQGLPDVLSRWGHGLPRERVHLVTVPQSGAPRNLLWDRFRQVFGIKEEWAPADSGRRNPSIGIAETMLVRRLNQRFTKGDLDGDPYRALVRELMVHETLANRERMTKATLPPRLFPWAEEVAEEWIDWVRGSGIDVVGDLAELRPVRPDPAEKWADPDRPDQREMVDAALDALVAITKEAARRPDPEVTVGRRLTRAARRLRGQ